MTTNPIIWQTAGSYTDILFEAAEGIAKITINRPARRNAFRPETVSQLIDAFHRAHHDNMIGAIVLTGAGNEAFCIRRRQKKRVAATGLLDEGGTPTKRPRLQMQIRRVRTDSSNGRGYAIGGGQSAPVAT